MTITLIYFKIKLIEFIIIEVEFARPSLIDLFEQVINSLRDINLSDS